MSNFWQNLPRPIIGLSPMDGVTDAPFRYVMAKFGRPDVIFTEFVPVEAITHNAVRVMSDLLYSEIERPIVAQVYGGDPESFYKVAHVVCELGFDGIDINMGCPAKKVVHRGCGAGLIQTPELAKQIVQAVRMGIQDWVSGQDLHSLGLSNRILKWVEAFKARCHCEERSDAAIQSGTGSPRPFGPRDDKCPIPISIKTRIGYSENIATDWVKHLLETEPAVITLHGRTLKQMYKGEADWEAIAAAAEIVHQTPTLVLGNGDVKSAVDAMKKIRASGVDGVLIGRATYGNPWVFRDVILSAAKDLALDSSAAPQNDTLKSYAVTPEEAMACMLEHARYFEEIRPDIRYVAMRKHFAWYSKWIPALHGRKKELMQINSYAELCDLVHLASHPELVCHPSLREGSALEILRSQVLPQNDNEGSSQ